MRTGQTVLLLLVGVLLLQTVVCHDCPLNQYYDEDNNYCTDCPVLPDNPSDVERLHWASICSQHTVCCRSGAGVSTNPRDPWIAQGPTPTANLRASEVTTSPTLRVLTVDNIYGGGRMPSKLSTETIVAIAVVLIAAAVISVAALVCRIKRTFIQQKLRQLLYRKPGPSAQMGAPSQQEKDQENQALFLGTSSEGAYDTSDIGEGRVDPEQQPPPPPPPPPRRGDNGQSRPQTAANRLIYELSVNQPDENEIAAASTYVAD